MLGNELVEVLREYEKEITVPPGPTTDPRSIPPYVGSTQGYRGAMLEMASQPGLRHYSQASEWWWKPGGHVFRFVAEIETPFHAKFGKDSP